MLRGVLGLRPAARQDICATVHGKTVQLGNLSP
jgi:hypothetical protein